MADSTNIGIWPPHEVFYIESLLHSTGAALRAAEDVRTALNEGSHFEPTSAEWQQHAFNILSGVQSLVLQAGSISRFFWPARAKEPHASRALRLRTSLSIGDDSALKNRALRNRLEHLDEHLDTFCGGLIAGVILPSYVGPSAPASDVPTHVFRAYFTDIGVFEILGDRFAIQPIYDEIDRLHDLLVECIESGGRLPRHRLTKICSRRPEEHRRQRSRPSPAAAER